MLPAAPGLAMNASVLARVREQRGQPRERAVRRRPAPLGTRRAGSIEAGLARLTALVLPLDRGRAADGAIGCGPRRGVAPVAIRSEEHTSELQSLMRISYAVFCLKKKKTRR